MFKITARFIKKRSILLLVPLFAVVTGIGVPQLLSFDAMFFIQTSLLIIKDGKKSSTLN